MSKQNFKQITVVRPVRVEKDTSRGTILEHSETMAFGGSSSELIELFNIVNIKVNVSLSLEESEVKNDTLTTKVYWTLELYNKNRYGEIKLYKEYVIPKYFISVTNKYLVSEHVKGNSTHITNYIKGSLSKAILKLFLKFMNGDEFDITLNYMDINSEIEDNIFYNNKPGNEMEIEYISPERQKYLDLMEKERDEMRKESLEMDMEIANGVSLSETSMMKKAQARADKRSQDLFDSITSGIPTGFGF